MSDQNRPSGGRRRIGAVKRRSGVALIAALVIAGASPSFAADYDPSTAGHPLRILAYAVHPVGVALEYLLVRPAHWLISTEPMKTVFGHKD